MKKPVLTFALWPVFMFSQAVNACCGMMTSFAFSNAALSLGTNTLSQKACGKSAGETTENRKTENEIAKPVNLAIQTTAADATAVDKTLAAHFPAEREATVIDMHRQLFNTCESENNPRTLGGALGTFIHGNHVARHNTPLDDNAAFNKNFDGIIAEFDETMRAISAIFQSISPKDRKETHIQLTMPGMQIIATLKNLQDGGGTAKDRADLQAAAKRNLETFTKVPADQIRIENGHLRIRCNIRYKFDGGTRFHSKGLRPIGPFRS